MKTILPLLSQLLLVVLGAMPQALFADAVQPKDLVITTVQKVREIVKNEEGKTSTEALDAKLKEVIFPVFDFEEMSKRSLGAHWADANPEQQKEFVRVFSDLLSYTYLKRIRENALSSTVSLVGEARKESKVEVRTLTKSSEGDVDINYRLYQKEDGWKIYDVVIASVGLVSNYRSEFAGIIRKEGMDGLLKRLREKELS